MDKATLDSVMEEIKKSLGEARLKKIFEDDEEKKDTETPAKPVPVPSSNAARMAPGAMTGGDFKPSAPAPTPAPAPKPVDASTQGTIDRMSTPGNAPGSGTSSVKSGVGGGLGFGIKGPESDKGPVATPKPSTPAPAPRGSDVTNQPRMNSVTNQPFSGNTYGYARSGSDDDTASNFFSANQRERAAQASAVPAKPAAPRPSVPRPAAPRPAVARGGSLGNKGSSVPTLAENFDQFVKKFLKESR